MVAEKICKVDRSPSRYIANPYLTALNANVAAIAGTYTVDTATTVDDTLTVSEQVESAVHLFEFEDSLCRSLVERKELWKAFPQSRSIQGVLALQGIFFRCATCH